MGAEQKAPSSRIVEFETKRKEVFDFLVEEKISK